MKVSNIKIKPFDKKEYLKVLSLIKDNNLTTVCLEANCPNRYECFSKRRATFMILGNVCTRNCLYCNIKSNIPLEVDKNEPKRIAQTIKKLNLNYAVITCVTRDDLKDGGADQFVKTIEEIKKVNKECKIEVLISDLKGDWNSLKKIIMAEPDVLNHNIEVVKDYFSILRPQGNYNLSLDLLKKVKEINSKIKTKSGLMVGFGETKKQIIKTLNDLKKVNCDILTIGQYLQPTNKHYEMKKEYSDKEFEEIKKIAQKLEFSNVLCGSLVRSSYMAGDYNERK